MTINNNNIIINNDSKFFTDSSDNKNLKNKKKNKSTNIAMIIQESNFDKLCNLCIGNKYIWIINYKSMILIR